MCRCPMLYRACGHVIMACEVQKALQVVEEEGMPESCVGSRSKDGVSGVDSGLRDELR